MSVEEIYRAPFLFIQEHKKNYKTVVDKALKGIWAKNILSNVFFSRENIKLCQNRLKKRVYMTGVIYKKKWIICDQDENDLIVVMRAVFLQYAKNLPYKNDDGTINKDIIKKQIDALDNIVVDEIIEKVIANIKQYMGYLEDINTPLMPPDRPENVSNKGRKSLPSVTTVLM